MTDEQIAYEGAKGLIETGVEGPFDTVVCSTAGDYPSIGVSCWEGSRADYLLSWIDGGLKFVGRSYSDIESSGQLEELANLLNSEQGQEAQRQILANDCLNVYLPVLREAGLINPLCIIYSMIWCPTSHRVVSIFVGNRLKWGYDVNDLNVLYKLFFDQYYIAADVGEDYKRGYQNRAINTFNYCDSLDLSQYG